MNKLKYYLAHIISIVFVPLFVPVYVLAIICFGFPQLAGGTLRPGLLISEFALIAVAGPLLSFYILYRLHIISSFTLNSRRDRFIPQLFTLFAYVIALGLFIQKQYSLHLRVILVANVILIFILMVITLWWKISAHTSGVSGMMAVMTFLLFKSPPHDYGFYYTLGWTAFFAVSFSRLYLRVHSPSQVFAGIALGGTIGSVSMMLI